MLGRTGAQFTSKARDFSFLLNVQTVLGPTVPPIIPWVRRALYLRPQRLELEGNHSSSFNA